VVGGSWLGSAYIVSGAASVLRLFAQPDAAIACYRLITHAYVDVMNLFPIPT